MSRAASCWHRLLVTLLFIGYSGSAVAVDPLTLVLLRMLRDQIISRSLEAVATAPATVPGAPTHQPLIIPEAPFDLGDERLKALIDEGFLHLAPVQRQEIFASVKKLLADPKNAAARPMIIEELAIKASAVRQAHERLNGLSRSEKQAIAAQAREEYEKLAPEERVQMVDVLRAGVVPIPRDLSELILVEFSRAQVATSQP